MNGTKIREALQQQSPSLALQRAAGDEIAMLDHELRQAMRQFNRIKTAMSLEEVQSILKEIFT